MPDNEQLQSSIILYQTEDGRTRIQCRFDLDTIWLTRRSWPISSRRTCGPSMSTVNIFEEGELSREATIRKFRIVRLEGAREVESEYAHV